MPFARGPPRSDLPPSRPVQLLTRPTRGFIHPTKLREHEVIGIFFNPTSRTATILGAALVMGAASATAQVPSTPDTVRPAPVQTDTTNNLVVSSDTTQDVTHVVKEDHTLWDLAQFYLKNPFRWPEIFRRNTDVVKDPHWIYPGEVIRISGTEVKPSALASADSAGEVVSHVVTRAVEPQVISGGRSDLTV